MTSRHAFTQEQLLALARKALSVALYPAAKRGEFRVHAYIPWSMVEDIRRLLLEYGYPLQETLESVKKQRKQVRKQVNGKV